MKKYYKHFAESDAGAGFVYLEFDGELAIRQVEVYGQQMFWSDLQSESNFSHKICDQPFSELDLTPKDEMSAEEFELTWRLAQMQPQ